MYHPPSQFEAKSAAKHSALDLSLFSEVWYQEARNGRNPGRRFTRVNKINRQLSAQGAKSLTPEARESLLSLRRTVVTEILTDERRKVQGLLLDGSLKWYVRQIKPKSASLDQSKFQPAYTFAKTDNARYLLELVLQRAIRNQLRYVCLSREATVQAVKTIAKSPASLQIVRTDIKSCFESMPRDLLVKLLIDSNKFPDFAIDAIKKLLDEYSRVSKSSTGIPRGIGLSAALAEYYLQALDSELLKLPNVVSVYRYVDDIAIVFSCTSSYKKGPLARSNEALVHSTIRSIGLEPNLSKSGCYSTGYKEQRELFDFLGYSFECENGKLKLSPTDEKCRKYEERIKACFALYDSNLASGQSQAVSQALLRQQLVLLSSNYKLSGAKSNVITGHYFNNRFVTEKGKFSHLDNQVRRELSQRKTINGAYRKKIMGSASFVVNFELKKTISVSPRRLKALSKAWKNVR